MFFTKASLLVAVLSVALSGVAGTPSGIQVDVQARVIQFRQVDGYSGVVTFPNGTTIDFGGDLAKKEIAAAALQSRVEVVTCYNVGTQLADQDINNALVEWCSAVKGTTLGPNGNIFRRTEIGNGFSVLLSATARPGCSFTIDDNCTRLLQEPLNQCNVNANDKQGGYETDPCGIWRTDPGTYFQNGSDF
ncbi:hypothetical protein B0H13DRAFT_2026083 [Mycena leptocephala]|nr:hypothetical protein B0H13DRAFT_2026083 [Mycena leptocephala]